MREPRAISCDLALPLSLRLKSPASSRTLATRLLPPSHIPYDVCLWWFNYGFRYINSFNTYLKAPTTNTVDWILVYLWVTKLKNQKGFSPITNWVFQVEIISDNYLQISNWRDDFLLMPLTFLEYCPYLLEINMKRNKYFYLMFATNGEVRDLQVLFYT